MADTKYEFGLASDGSVLLIDEMHTPDSSRYWELNTYQARLDSGEEPESLDKEPVRLALDAVGYNGSGNPPVLDAAIISATTQRYISAYTRLTGRQFIPGEYPVQQRLKKSTKYWSPMMSENYSDSVIADRLHEECGVMGISSPAEDVAQMVFFGLFALQHRGQEAAGIAVSDGVQARYIKQMV